MLPTLEPTRVRPGDHVVQFYEEDADLVARAGDYLFAGLQAGGVAVVIATEAHRRAFAERLNGEGVDGSAVRWLDAAATLAALMPSGRIERSAFFDVVGGVIRQAGRDGRPVCAYGEMVALLWDAGEVLAAIELEALWNELSLELAFSLYCAYRSDSVAGHGHADALHHVCNLHRAVVPVDAGEVARDFPLDPGTAPEARHLVSAALVDWGHAPDVVADAELVATEMATNAILHARTPFRVVVQRFGPAIRISVQDRASAIPSVLEPDPTRPSGRGMHLISVLSRRWGVEVGAGGKTVWAELGR